MSEFDLDDAVVGYLLMNIVDASVLLMQLKDGLTPEAVARLVLNAIEESSDIS